MTVKMEIVDAINNLEFNNNINNYNQINIPKIPKGPNFTHIVFSGGGMKGAVYIGVLRYLYQEPELIKNIKTIVGTSVGSLFATAFLLNIPLIEIEEYWKNLFDFNKKNFDISLENIFNIYDTCGLDNNMRSLNLIMKYIQKLTFIDLTKKTGKDLIICATNAHTMKPEYFSVNTTPNVLVCDALLASASLPLIMKPVQIGNTYYTDGGITDNIPVSCISSHISSDNILVISLQNEESNIMHKLNFPILLLNILLTLISNPGLIDIYKQKYKYFVDFDIPLSSVEYIIDETNLYLCTSIQLIDKCYEIGYKTMYLKIKEWKNN